MELGEGWSHVVRGGYVAKASTTSPANPRPNPLPPQVAKAPEQTKVTATRETARPQKSEPKSKVAPKRTAEKPKKSAAGAKPVAAKNTPPNLVVPTQTSTSPLEEISDLLDHLSLPACKELCRRLFASIPSLPTGTARSRAVLKIAILFVAEYDDAP